MMNMNEREGEIKRKKTGATVGERFRRQYIKEKNSLSRMQANARGSKLTYAHLCSFHRQNVHMVFQVLVYCGGEKR